MARIRTIKPEFWESETIASLPIEARLLFIACLNLADDEGRLRWHPSYLRSFAFVYDAHITIEQVEKWMQAITHGGLTEVYVNTHTRGTEPSHCAQIINFKEHQRVNRPTPSKFPPPPPKRPGLSGETSKKPAETQEKETFTEDSLSIHGGLTEDSLPERKGKEGKGKEGREIRRAKPANPTLEEVKAYCVERRNHVDPDQFFDHYTANGWTQGRGKPIKDWHAAVRTWERNEFGQKRKETAAIQESNAHKPKTMTAESARYQLVKIYGIAEARDWPDERVRREYMATIVQGAPRPQRNLPEAS